MSYGITIQHLRLYAYHGVAQQERLIGNEYLIDAVLTVEDMKAMVSDNVEDTINYADVVDDIKQEMAVPSQLLEHIVWRIIRRLFNDFPTLQAIQIHLQKRMPPMGADIQSCGVQLKVERKDL